ncbi:hypothetical protein ACI1US_02541 [Leucobacter sp. BZR 635]
MSGLRSAARVIGWAGLTAAGALHAIWASGSPWPERNAKRLGEAVVGSSKGVPDAQSTWVVAGTALAGGAVAAGALGEGRSIVAVRRLAGAAMLARAAFGGEAALDLMGRPAPGARFRDLDRRYYRPLFGVLGTALIIGAKKKPKKVVGSTDG